LNLILAGLQVATQMPNQIGALKQSFANLKGIPDPKSASAAVADMQTRVAGLWQLTHIAFQTH
jgi:hypothetical protein